MPQTPARIDPRPARSRRATWSRSLLFRNKGRPPVVIKLPGHLIAADTRGSLHAQALVVGPFTGRCPFTSITSPLRAATNVRAKSLTAFHDGGRPRILRRARSLLKERYVRRTGRRYRDSVVQVHPGLCRDHHAAAWLHRDAAPRTPKRPPKISSGTLRQNCAQKEHRPALQRCRRRRA